MYGVAPIHPGEHLREILAELGISRHRLAESAGIPPAQIDDVVGGSRPVTAEMALGIGKALGMSPEFWLNLQRMYDRDEARAAGDVGGVEPRVGDNRL